MSLDSIQGFHGWNVGSRLGRLAFWRFRRNLRTLQGLHGEHVRRTTKRSRNTGIITFINYNSRVPPKVSQLTLTHEIGHNFGSPHNYPSHCRPGGQNGTLRDAPL